MEEIKIKVLRDEGVIPETTYRLLCKLIKLKEDESKQKKRRLWVSTTLVSLYAFFIFYLFFIKLSGLTVLDPMRSVSTDPLILCFGLLCIFIHFVWVSARNKYEEAKEDFDDLRKEMIDRYEELWFKQIDQSGKDETLRFLNDEKDINLYHK
ncbi:DUF2663 family protein [Terrilactibacillus laevilacticus]|uniref:DUF2663 family protein n=1 Tax=Terrilactibacillus laevilacticus TaxID=1380157 RepID=A0ABW5PRY2_9BACI|nr:DUF2663 family protein [Terrilactibacillus laevilacticus]